MKQYIDSDSKKNEIRMLLKHPSFKGKVIAVLEGDTDIRLFRSLMDENHIKIEAAVGKSCLTEIICDLTEKEEYEKRLFGICDADFVRIAGDPIDCESIFLTDTHDSEMMMINSPAIDALIAEYAANDESATLLRESLVQTSLDAAYELGVYRYINHIYDSNINFKGLHIDLYSKINGLEIVIDHAKLIEALVTRSPNSGESVTKEWLTEEYGKKSDKSLERLEFCNGHDVTKFVSYILRQKHLSNDAQVNQEKVERSLRLSYSGDCFKSTQLYKKLIDWISSKDAPAFLC